MKYLLVKTSGNGYRCGCCRREDTFTEEEEFSSDQDAIDFAKEYNNKHYDKDDICINYIYPIGECIYEF